MPAKNFLDPEQKQILQKELRENSHPGIRARVLIFLLLNDGRTQVEVANFVGCSVRTVAYWSVHGDPENLESLKDERMKGNYRKATDEYIDLLLKTVETEPEANGYEFGRWTAARLSTHLEQQTGIALTGTQIRRILAAKKYRYLWARYSLDEKQDPEQRAAFKQRLEVYLEISQQSPERVQVWFWDESGFSLRVIRRKTWGRKGKRKKLSGRRRKGRVNVMGALRYSDKKRWVDFVPSGNSESFYTVLKALYEEAKQDWINLGNMAEDFEAKGAKIVIILDNASYHKKSEVLDKISQEMPNLVLEFLPTYSPDYNLIELVWHSAKEYIANRLFESVEQLEILLHKLLNEGELIIKWGQKRKNKGNAINAI